MESLKEEVSRIKQLILVEQNLKDEELLDSACKVWSKMPFDKKRDFEDKSVDILNQDDPIDMDVVCEAKKEGNFKEAIPNDNYRKVIKSLIPNTI